MGLGAHNFLEANPLRITIIGSGHVGLVTGGCLAHIGHRITINDGDADRLRLLDEGRLPFYERYLDDLIQCGRNNGAIRFSPDSGQAVKDADAVFLCVGASELDNGDSDFSALDSVARQIAPAMETPGLIVVRSTVPVQTGEKLKHLLSVYSRNRSLRFRVAANPQFLREGTAVEDFLHPDRILLGVEDPDSEDTLRQIYAPILRQTFPCPIHLTGCPPRVPPVLLPTNLQSAELIKHATNAFLAMKISYSNVLAELCDRLGGNVKEVTRAMGLDPRIGPQFLEAGIGFGGSRLPNDLRAFCRLKTQLGVDAGILLAAEAVNKSRPHRFFEQVQRSLWVLKDKRIALLGLAHKEGTDDIRGSPAIDLFKCFTSAGAHVRAFDPRAMAQARSAHPQMICGVDAYEVAEQADALILGTAWKEFLELDWKRIHRTMARPVVFDGRNLLSPSEMKAMEFEYHSVGRPS